MWFAAFGFLAILVIWFAWKDQLRYALGASVVLSLLVPSWVAIPVGRFSLDVTVAISLFGLFVYFIQKKGDVWPRKINAIDAAFVFFFFANLISDWLYGGFTSGALPRSCGEWLAPYLAGRLAIQSWDDLRRLTPVVLAICVVLCLLAAIESFGKINLFESIFGIRTGDEMPREVIRWGLKRAFVTVKNPLYFGVLLLLLSPWTFYAATRAAQRDGPNWWFFAPALVAMGILFSVSRGPLLGLIVSAYVTAVIIIPRWRLALIGSGIVSLGLLASNHQTAVTFLDWLSDRSPRRHTEVIVDDQKEVLTPTTNRFLLVKVYGPAMRRAGLFGFGTERTSTFPPQVPMGPQDPNTMRRIWTVDNTYVLLILRFGYLGVGSFVLLGLTAIRTYATLGHRLRLPHSIFAGAMAGSIVSTLLILCTVWMPHDFGFFLVWTYGIASGLHDQGSQQETHGAYA